MGRFLAAMPLRIACEAMLLTVALTVGAGWSAAQESEREAQDRIARQVGQPAASAKGPPDGYCEPLNVGAGADEAERWRVMSVRDRLFDENLLRYSVYDIGCLRPYELSALTTMLATCEAFGLKQDEHLSGQCDVAQNIFEHVRTAPSNALGRLLFAAQVSQWILRIRQPQISIEDQAARLKRLGEIRDEWRNAVRFRHFIIYKEGAR